MIAGMDEKPTKRGGPLYWLKRRSRRFWIAVAVLPVLYVLSIGPVCWSVSWTHIGAPEVSVVYRQITRVMVRNQRVGAAIESYTGFWAAPSWKWTFGSDPQHDSLYWTHVVSHID